MAPDPLQSSELILASASPHRKVLLDNAGLRFLVEAARIDERSVETSLADSGATPADLALVLATTKAEDVSARHPRAFVIGCDQTLSLEGELLHKAADMDEARRKLLRLSGRTHRLDSAVVVARNGQTLWSHIEPVTMTMRELTPAAVGRYLAEAGAAALTSVGAYQIEGPGIRLFERIDGDYFAIIGLPLLPLLAALRDLGALDD
ncbi:MAG: Maf-like protein [Rhizobiaceae bacterium]|nr:Maf-like protein [Rhizobiaceae bacterium]MCV0404667.1 Maf-like protein [Rhizobiaceae bacterium]